MDDVRKIKECLRELAGSAPVETEVAKVLGADGAECTVERVRDGMVISPVRLNAVSTADKGIVVTPKTGTYVLVSRLGESGWFVTLCGEVEKITIDAETDIVINGGSFGGLVRIEDLVGTLQHIVNTFNTHTHTVPNGTSAIPATPMDPIQRDGMENTKIRHG